MNAEIKRLLKLSSIPGFRMSKKEIATLEAWKAQQVPVKPKRTYKRKKVQNVIKKEELETNSES